MSVMEKMMILSGTLWIFAVAFIIYAWILQNRQQFLLRYIAGKLKHIESLLQPQQPQVPESLPSDKKNANPKTSITIDKNEPLSKYETVTLPDEININFVDR